MPANVSVTFVLATHNRRAITLDTLNNLLTTGRPTGHFEVIVVDNASTDGTAQAVRTQFPTVTLLAEAQNLGSCAKALGVDRAAGRFVVFLDDDSYPRPGTIDRMIEHFEADPQLAAAGFRVHLPDGREECSALANVFVGCGVGFRAEALTGVGGLDRTFFMQAEEYDLSFKLINAGWKVRTFADLHVEHLKTPRARRSGRTVYYDTRNNLILADRYLPEPYRTLYRQDWLQRYGWLAAGDRRFAALACGALAGTWRGLWDRAAYAERRLQPAAFERLFRMQFVRDHMQRVKDAGAGRIVLADLGKNVLAFHRAAEATGLTMTAIGDDRFAAAHRRYRGLPVVTLDDALRTRPDAVVVANTSPVHAVATRRRLATRFDGPVHGWFAAQWDQ